MQNCMHGRRQLPVGGAKFFDILNLTDKGNSVLGLFRMGKSSCSGHCQFLSCALLQRFFPGFSKVRKMFERCFGFLSLYTTR